MDKIYQKNLEVSREYVYNCFWECTGYNSAINNKENVVKYCSTFKSRQESESRRDVSEPLAVEGSKAASEIQEQFNVFINFLEKVSSSEIVKFTDNINIFGFIQIQKESEEFQKGWAMLK